MLRLYQAEWCPFSGAVRELLTELGLPFVAEPVEPWPEQREELRRETGFDSIPVLKTEDGRFLRGTRAIFRYLETLPGSQYAADHRRRFLDHRPAREEDVVAQLVERASLNEPAEAPPAGEPETRHVAEQDRYELWLGGRRIGLLSYRDRGDRRLLLHTEITPECEGRGYGTRLVHDVLVDAHAHAVEIVPLCPFVAAYVARHPEDEDLVPPEYRRR